MSTTYDHQWRVKDFGIKTDLVLQKVIEIRASQPRIGTAKFYYMLQSFFKEHQIKIGRDGLYNLMRTHKLDIRKCKRYACTTDSNHWMRKYNNLISQLQIIQPETVWVSDITYIKFINQ